MWSRGEGAEPQSPSTYILYSERKRMTPKNLERSGIKRKGIELLWEGKGERERERGGCSYCISNHLFCFLFSKCMGRVGIHSILYIPKHNVFLSSSIIYATCVYNLRDFVVIYFNTFTIINICSEISIYINKLEDKEYEHLFVFIWVQL